MREGKHYFVSLYIRASISNIYTLKYFLNSSINIGKRITLLPYFEKTTKIEIYRKLLRIKNNNLRRKLNHADACFRGDRISCHAPLQTT